MKSFTNSTIFTETLFMKLVPAFTWPLVTEKLFRKPPVILKIVRKTLL